MKMSARVLSLSLVLLAASGCGGDGGAGIDATPEAAPDAQAASTVTPEAGVDTAPQEAEVQAEAFDPAQLPLSEVPLGDFPYITLPAGYSADGRVDQSKDFARFPFWVDGREHWVEGRFHEFNFAADEGKTFSRLEVQRNLESLVRQLGGRKVSEGDIPYETVKSWGDEIITGFSGGLGDVYNNPAATYVVRHASGNIWIHLVADTSQAWIVLGQEEGFEATASLMPASEIDDALEREGNVALEVNFATDSAVILEDSMPQVDAVVQLFAMRPGLRLAINGHTDNSGSSSHNMALSKARAEAVVDALASRGVERSRMEAEGFGDTRPVADNASEEGRARNRRVELVKL